MKTTFTRGLSLRKLIKCSVVDDVMVMKLMMWSVVDNDVVMIRSVVDDEVVMKLCVVNNFVVMMWILVDDAVVKMLWYLVDNDEVDVVV